MASPDLRKYGDLQAIEIKGRTDAPTIVFFHGYGADCHDLAPLARSLGVSRDINWFFPNGPLSIPLGGHYEGRGWFPVSIASLEQAEQSASRRGGPDAAAALDFSREAPPGMRKAREAALGALSAAGIRIGNAILGGFSQGAMMAMDLAVRGAEPPLGLALLSGTLVDEPNWRRLASERKGATFFQSHGLEDPILSIRGAERLEAMLLECGWQGKLLKFDGEHEIPLEAQSGLSVYLRSRLNAPKGQ
jgi:phospholipase/carboxylesterase